VGDVGKLADSISVGAPETWLGMQMEHDLWHASRRAFRLKVKRLYQAERKAA